MNMHEGAPDKEIAEGEERTPWDDMVASLKEEEKSNLVAPKKSRYIKTDDGKYRVTFPAMIDLKTGNGVGMTRRDFDTPEEAEEFLNNLESPKDMMKEYELLHLVKSPSEIKKTTDGGYDMRRIGKVLKIRNHDALLTAPYHADSLDEVASVMQDNSRKIERVDGQEFLALELADTKLSFSTFDNFEPSASLETEAAPVPETVKRLLSRDTDGYKTYQKTLEDPEWKTKLFMDLQGQLDRKDSLAQKIAKKYRIKNNDLRGITPKQAIGFTSELVMATTLYDYDATDGRDNPADRMSVSEMLHHGLDGIRYNNRKPLGVCRNFASMERAIFESIKAGQGELNQLRNTYIFTMGSDERIEYGDFAPDKYDDAGHAWNNYIQVSHDGTKADMILTDVTWGKYDLKTGRTVGFDQSSERTVAVVHKIEKKLPDTEAANRERIRIMRYYADSMNQPGGKNKFRTLANLMIDVLIDHPEIQSACEENAGLLGMRAVYSLGYNSIMNKNHLEVLGRIKPIPDDPQDKKRLDAIFEHYLSRDNPFMRLAGIDGYIMRSSDLQIKLFEHLKKVGQYEEVLARYPKLKELAPNSPN